MQHVSLGLFSLCFFGGGGGGTEYEAPLSGKVRGSSTSLNYHPKQSRRKMEVTLNIVVKLGSMSDSCCHQG